MKREGFIHIDRIKPFFNKCKVSGINEMCNIEISYIPDKYVLELASYRTFFEQGFNLYIEELAEMVYDKISSLIHPKELRVEVFLIEPRLTPWSVVIR